MNPIFRSLQKFVLDGLVGGSHNPFTMDGEKDFADCFECDRRTRKVDLIEGSCDQCRHEPVLPNLPTKRQKCEEVPFDCFVDRLVQDLDVRAEVQTRAEFSRQCLDSWYRLRCLSPSMYKHLKLPPSVKEYLTKHVKHDISPTIKPPNPDAKYGKTADYIANICDHYKFSDRLKMDQIGVLYENSSGFILLVRQHLDIL